MRAMYKFIAILALVLAACAARAASSPAKLGPAEFSRLVEQHQGSVVVVNFWASWCGPCRNEFPVLERLRRCLDDDQVAIIGISLDFDPDMFMEFAQRHGFGYPVYLAHEDLMAQLDIEAIPKTLIFDKKGHLVSNHDGPDSFAELHAEIMRHCEDTPEQGADQ